MTPNSAQKNIVYTVFFLSCSLSMNKFLHSFSFLIPCFLCSVTKGASDIIFVFCVIYFGQQFVAMSSDNMHARIRTQRIVHHILCDATEFRLSQDIFTRKGPFQEGQEVESARRR